MYEFQGRFDCLAQHWSLGQTTLYIGSPNVVNSRKIAQTSGCCSLLVTQESSVIFVDMRGLLGELMCTTGDVHYDLSKVYQSLCGYDFIILDREMDATAAKNLCDLKEVWS